MGIGAAIVAAAVIGTAATVIGGRSQSKAIKQSTTQSINEQRRQFDISQQLTAPRREAENAALAQLQNILGIGEQDFDISGINIPGQQFAIDEASQAIERSASARGGLVSGNTLAELQSRALGITNQNFLSNVLNPLQNLALGTSGAQAGQSAINLGVNVGNIQQQAGINRANVIGSTAGGVNAAIQGGLSNILLLNALKPTGGNIPIDAAGAARSSRAAQSILFGGP